MRPSHKHKAQVCSNDPLFSLKGPPSPGRSPRPPPRLIWRRLHHFLQTAACFRPRERTLIDDQPLLGDRFTNTRTRSGTMTTMTFSARRPQTQERRLSENSDVCWHAMANTGTTYRRGTCGRYRERKSGTILFSITIYIYTKNVFINWYRNLVSCTTSPASYVINSLWLTLLDLSTITSLGGTDHKQKAYFQVINMYIIAKAVGTLVPIFVYNTLCNNAMAYIKVYI